MRFLYSIYIFRNIHQTSPNNTTPKKSQAKATVRLVGFPHITWYPTSGYRFGETAPWNDCHQTHLNPNQAIQHPTILGEPTKNGQELLRNLQTSPKAAILSISQLITNQITNQSHKHLSWIIKPLRNPPVSQGGPRRIRWGSPDPPRVESTAPAYHLPSQWTMWRVWRMVHLTMVNH